MHHFTKLYNFSHSASHTPREKHGKTSSVYLPKLNCFLFPTKFSVLRSVVIIHAISAVFLRKKISSWREQERKSELASLFLHYVSSSAFCPRFPDYSEYACQKITAALVCKLYFNETAKNYRRLLFLSSAWQAGTTISGNGWKEFKRHNASDFKGK